MYVIINCKKKLLVFLSFRLIVIKYQNVSSYSIYITIQFYNKYFYSKSKIE